MAKEHYWGKTYEELYKYIHEDYAPSDILYFVTVTLPPKLFKYSAITQYEMTINELRSIFATWTDQFTLTVELTTAGSVHYHALAKIPTKLQIFRFIEAIKKKRVLGFMKINNTPVHLDEMLKKSCNYLIKDLHVTKEIIRRGTYTPDLLFIKNM